MALELAPRELGWITPPNRPFNGLWHPARRKLHIPKKDASARDPRLPDAARIAQLRGSSGPETWEHSADTPRPTIQRRGCRAGRQQRLWPPDWAQNDDDNKHLNQQPPPTGRRAAAAEILSAAANIFGTRYPTQSTARGPRTSLGPASPGTRRESPSPLQFRTDHEQAGDSD